MKELIYPTPITPSVVKSALQRRTDFAVVSRSNAVCRQFIKYRRTDAAHSNVVFFLRFPASVGCDFVFIIVDVRFIVVFRRQFCLATVSGH